MTSFYLTILRRFSWPSLDYYVHKGGLKSHSFSADHKVYYLYLMLNNKVPILYRTFNCFQASHTLHMGCEGKNK